MARRSIRYAMLVSAVVLRTWAAAPAYANTGPVVDLSEDTTTCFDTFTAALAEATGGRIDDAPATADEASTDEQLDARIDAPFVGELTFGVEPKEPVKEFVLSIEYAARDFGGSANIFTGSSGCTAADDTVDFSVAFVGNDWNDIISSFRTFSGCRVKHYEHRDFGGASLPYQTTQDYIGDAMNDQTSSLQWT
jgi:hypothetical protein